MSDEAHREASRQQWGGAAEVWARAAEDGNRQARFQGPAIRAGIDAEGEAADDGNTLSGQVASQLAGDLTTVGARPPRSHHRNRGGGRQSVQQDRISAADQCPRGTSGGPKANGVAVLVPADRPALGGGQGRSKAALGQRLNASKDLSGDLRCRSPGELLATERHEIQRAPARGGGDQLLDIGGQLGQQPPPAQALRTSLWLVHRFLLRSGPAGCGSRCPGIARVACDHAGRRAREGVGAEAARSGGIEGTADELDLGVGVGLAVVGESPGEVALQRRVFSSRLRVGAQPCRIKGRQPNRLIGARAI